MDIEEAITLLKCEIKYEINRKLSGFDDTDVEAIQVLLADRERLIEENIHWRGQYHLLSRKILPNYIEKDKIRAKIEELRKRYVEIQEITGNGSNSILNQIQVLEELLESEE